MIDVRLARHRLSIVNVVCATSDAFPGLNGWGLDEFEAVEGLLKAAGIPLSPRPLIVMEEGGAKVWVKGETVPDRLVD